MQRDLKNKIRRNANIIGNSATNKTDDSELEGRKLCVPRFRRGLPFLDEEQLNRITLFCLFF